MGLTEPAESPPASQPTSTAETPEPEPVAAAVEPARPVLGPRPGPIVASDPPAVAGRKAMWLHVERMLQREAALRDPSQPDALRRYRVATRRLRAALRVFRAALPAREVRALRAGLAEIATTVGTVRDLDVRIGHLEGWAAEQGPEWPAWVEPLRATWASEREAAAARVARRLESRAHQRLTAALASFVAQSERGSRALDGSPTLTIRDRTASAVWDGYERLRAYTAVVPWADVETLHGVRIQAKRLRYTIEFLGDLLGPEQAWVHARLVTLQDHLGALNDALLATIAVRSFLAEHHARLEPASRQAVERYLTTREREVVRLRRGFGRVWRPIVGVTFARRLGRAVIGRP